MSSRNRPACRGPRVLAIITPGHESHLLVATTTAPPRASRSAKPSGMPLQHALAACLQILEDNPPRFQRAATTWHANWCLHVPTLTLAEAQVTIAALALAGPDPVAGARELCGQAIHHGHRDVADVLERWIARREAPAALTDARELNVPAIGAATA